MSYASGDVAPTDEMQCLSHPHHEMTRTRSALKEKTPLRESGMRIQYEEAIVESLDDLREHEERLHGSKSAVRVRALSLLKSGQARNLSEAAELVGYSPTQVARWWQRYRTQGLAKLEQEPRYPGMPARMTPEARADVDAAMKRGEIKTLEEARGYLREHWQIEYQSIHGIWWHLRHKDPHRKTRHYHKPASTAQQAEALP